MNVGFLNQICYKISTPPKNRKYQKMCFTVVGKKSTNIISYVPIITSDKPKSIKIIWNYCFTYVSK